MTSLSKDKASAGDSIPAKCAVIEVHVGELRQLFDAIDPSPFRDRDLDPKAEDFILGWPRTCPVTYRLGWLWTSIARQVYPTRLLFCETRFMSSSGIALKHIGNGSENCSGWVGPAW